MRLDYEEGTKLLRACVESADYKCNAADRAKVLGTHIRDFQNAIKAKADAEASAAKAMYEEGLLVVRMATAKLVQQYIERIAELERQLAAQKQQ